MAKSIATMPHECLLCKEHTVDDYYRDGRRRQYPLHHCKIKNRHSIEPFSVPAWIPCTQRIVKKWPYLPIMHAPCATSKTRRKHADRCLRKVANGSKCAPARPAKKHTNTSPWSSATFMGATKTENGSSFPRKLTLDKSNRPWYNGITLKTFWKRKGENDD